MNSTMLDTETARELGMLRPDEILVQVATKPR